MDGHAAQVHKVMVAERYFRRKNDIVLMEPKKDEEGNPLRSADNRIASNFYGLLVNQKAAYLFSDPPIFDIGSKQSNAAVADALGDGFAKKCKGLCINASNACVGWLHVWEDERGKFQYGVVDSKQVIPVWSSDLEKRLLAVLRAYDTIDDETGDIYTVYEYWTETECTAYRRLSSAGLDTLMPYHMFPYYNQGEELADYTDTLLHNWGEVPFIPFFNNESCTSDLDMVKDLIDSYDKVFSGFLNDLEDIQQIIFVLSGYGGEDLKTFLSDLKQSKAIKVDSTLDNQHPGVETLTINIPVEAREKMLTITRKAIFEQGQGIDPDPQNFGDSSGVALKFLYSLLELKSGLMETEFRLGFGRLVRLICRHLGVSCDRVNQTWTRTSVTNDTELADIATKSTGVISQRTILRRHPWVDDPEEEQKQLDKEAKQDEQKKSQFSFPGLRQGGDTVDGNIGE